MSREEQYTRWVLKERRRLEEQRDDRELLNMRVVEEQQRAVEREQLRREKVERERALARKKEERRLRAMEKARRG